MNENRQQFQSTARTAFKRRAQRGTHDQATINAILDEGFVCHVAFVADQTPMVLPTAYARRGDHLLLHGSASNRTLRALADGAEACIAVTLVDGLVFARSAFHHSVNYRSVVVFGRATEVVAADEKLAALAAIVEHIAPGRTSETRAPTAEELGATKVLEVSIDEAGAKIRTGPPVDDEEDHALPFWAGVVPLTTVAGVPVPCPRLAAGIETPRSARNYRRL